MDVAGFGVGRTVLRVMPTEPDGVLVSAHGAEGAVTVYYDWRAEVLFHESPGAGGTVVLYVAGF